MGAVRHALRSVPPGLFAAVSICLLRLLVIDIDPPVRDLTDYLAKDEGFYAEYAIDYYERGRSFEQTGPTWFGLPMVTNLLAYATLAVFGDNYHGLRSGSVILSVLCIVLMTAIMKRCTKDPWCLNLLPVIMATDLSFGFAGIMVEPTISRMAMMLLVLVIVVRVLERGDLSWPRMAMLGAVATFLSLPTYPTNFFVIPAAWSAGVLLLWQGRRGWRTLSSATMGYALGIVFALAILFGAAYVLGSHDIADLAKSKGNFGTRIAISPAGWIYNLQHLPYANIFRLDPALMFLWAFAMLLLLVLFRNAKPAAIAVCAFIGLFLLQTLVINDYPRRKLVILLPLVLLCIAAAFDIAQRAAVAPRWARWRAFAFHLILLATAWQTWMHLKTSRHEPRIIELALWPGIAVLFAVGTAAVLLRVHQPDRFFRFRWVLLLPLMIPGTINSVRTMVIERRYAYRQFTTSLRELDHQHFIGAASLGFRVNNDIDAEFSPYLVPGGVDSSWVHVARRAEADAAVNYSIGYLDQLEEFQRIGFHPSRVVVMDPEETWRERQFIVYKEGPPERSIGELISEVQRSTGN